MPEMPEVQGLAHFLAGKLVPEDGEPARVGNVELGSFAVLKTAEVPLDAVSSMTFTGVDRRGKFLILSLEGVYLVMHLARAGWLRWSNALPDTALRPGKGPIALRLRCSEPAGYGFDLTEAGTKKSAAVYLVRKVAEVPGVSRLGPEALDIGREQFMAMLHGHRSQVKSALRDQSFIAGIGNAYSDEILHAARLSPFALASKLTDEQVGVLHDAMHSVLQSAIAAADGKPAKELKDSKRREMKVHGRTGQPCPVCGDSVREISFADSALQYCPTCQTGGKQLADRRTSKFLK
ncbi:Fpg/Nei family DNA glycosylase [Arthrobacter parietis]|uniref:DNA-formamidopyrimidine glycosylase family protein n=2 Tax=Arthrobacter TaxID=1663 RepID=A0ABT6CVI3_9MICC|nr:DNA-formamidopyrimidine glycosylase family protein [Arthrobacter vasquezii]MDF9278080.1 DNA-formamidopyrimidine glycosylase family protein [Arthrobacter vasquezii]